MSLTNQLLVVNKNSSHGKKVTNKSKETKENIALSDNSWHQYHLGNFSPITLNDMLTTAA